MASRVGALAYGSLIDDPGPELQPRIVARLNAMTPFRVEFARKSESRGYGPTLIPVVEGGAHVRATVLVLDDDLAVDEATHMLYRREKHDFNPTILYRRRAKPSLNTIVIECLENFEDISVVLYTSIGANILNLSGTTLAQLAIDSVASPRSAEDGISYLIDAKRNGIVTPLSVDYEAAILRRTGAASLEAALQVLIEDARGSLPSST